MENVGKEERWIMGHIQGGIRVHIRVILLFCVFFLFFLCDVYVSELYLKNIAFILKRKYVILNVFRIDLFGNYISHNTVCFTGNAHG